MIVQYVEPDFMDSVDAFPKADSSRIKTYLKFLIEYIENSDSIEDLLSIDMSDFSLYGPLARTQDENSALNLLLPEKPSSSIVIFSLLSGKSTERTFPLKDLYLFRFAEYRLFFCLRGQVCTFLRIESNNLPINVTDVAKR